MASPDENDELVEHARAALRRLGEAAPSREVAEAALEEIEAAWQRRPFAVGVAGEDVAARTELLNALCGGAMFERDGRGPGAAPVRVRRGAATRFAVTHRDGAVEEATLADGGEASGLRRPPAEMVRAQVGEQELELLRAERAVPRLVREVPPWWAFWLWLVRWLVVRRAQARLAAWERAKAQLAESQRALAAAEETGTAVIRGRAETRARFFERLRTLGSGSGVGRDVRELALEVTAGPLTEDVEVIELTGAALAAKVDASVRVAGGHVEVAGGERGLGRPLGSPAEAAFRIARLPIEARAQWIARRAREVLIAEIAQLGDAVARAEATLRHRLARIETLQMPAAERFVAAQLERVGTGAAASIHAVLEHAGAHLGSELAERAARWDEQLAAARAPDELKALAARIDEEGVTESKRIAEETGTLVMGGVGGSAHDLLPELFSALRQPGMPDEHAAPPRAVPALPRVPMLPSLADPAPSTFAAELSGAGKWIAGLFRSIDSRRAELRDKVRQRGERVRGGGVAVLLDAVGRELAAAVERRVAWLEAERASEQLAADGEREALRPLVEVLDDARLAERGLAERMSGLSGRAGRAEPAGPDAAPHGAIAPGAGLGPG
ncbi:MAG TPA: hypothetical protein VK932_10090 [Kofleriaceae bacterium]|nr:hypothetical protein [Kofleriaceae bacterium]